MNNFYSCIFLYVMCNKHILLVLNIYISAIHRLWYGFDIFSTFLGAFTKLLKNRLWLCHVRPSLCLSVRPSARPSVNIEQLGFH